MKVQCLVCTTVSDSTEWLETDFYCPDCNDDHEGIGCPTRCGSVEGPGVSGFVEVKV